MREAPRLPATIDVSKFAVGRNLALTPGAVVLRDERFELIQYKAATPEVREVPVLLVPPMINKFYVMDLAPGRSQIEHLVQTGQEVFAISWRNPRAEQHGWGLDAYADAVVEAFDAVLDISGCDRTHLLGYCAGGLVAAATTSYLAAVGRLEQVASLTLGVCVIDNQHSNVLGAFATEEIMNVAAAASAKKGYLDGGDLASIFLWLRPNDLIWPYVVNNWLLGKDPPTFDILYWNADTTRMPAGLHRDFLEISSANAMCRPGEVTVLGSPVDLGSITVDSYVMAGAVDHISPWQNCYRTTQLLGGRTRFVLSTSGHIAAIVNPPGNQRANYRTAGEQAPSDPAQWEELATTSQGTWWTRLGRVARRALGRACAPRPSGSAAGGTRSWARHPGSTSSRSESTVSVPSRRCVRNSRTIAADRSASSRRKRWPPPVITSSRACGNRRARIRPLASGMIGSSSPAMTSVGWSMDGNQG